MIPNDLRYIFPSGAYFFVGAFLLFLLFWNLYFYRRKLISQFASPQALDDILVPRSRYNYWSKTAAICVAWILATLAFMQPIGNGHYPSAGTPESERKPPKKEDEGIIRRKMHDVIFLIDASASMKVQDTRTHVSRFDYAKEIVDDMMSKLKGENVALYAFTSGTTKLSPLTMDYLFVRLMLRQMQINEGDMAGTDIAEALNQMRKDFFSTLTSVSKSLILVTDGGDNKLEGLQGSERDKQIHSIVALLGDSQENHLRLYTIGMGTKQGTTIPGLVYEGKPVMSSLDEDLLKILSQAGRGKYYFANDWNAEDLAADLISSIDKEQTSIEDYKIRRPQTATKGGEDLIYDLFFQIPLGIGILLLAFVIFFPDTRERRKE